MAYTPTPISTDDIELPQHLQDLIERLAENAHDVWARERIKGGWSYGPERNDARLEHPCLVEYRALPESEKAYDRLMATQTIKVILKLGYRIA